MNEELKVGDTVVPLTGGPLMVVRGFRRDKWDTVDCDVLSKPPERTFFPRELLGKWEETAEEREAREARVGAA